MIIGTSKMDITTIKIAQETKSRLNKLKEFERESYDQVLRKMLYILNEVKKNPEKARKFLMTIDKTIKREKAFMK